MFKRAGCSISEVSARHENGTVGLGPDMLRSFIAFTATKEFLRERHVLKLISKSMRFDLVSEEDWRVILSRIPDGRFARRRKLLLRYCQILNSQKRYDEAVLRLEAALQICPGNADLAIQLGRTLSLQWNWQQACEVWARLRSTKPNVMLAWTEGIESAVRLGECGQAICLIGEVVSRPELPKWVWRSALKSLLRILARTDERDCGETLDKILFEYCTEPHRVATIAEEVIALAKSHRSTAVFIKNKVIQSKCSDLSPFGEIIRFCFGVDNQNTTILQRGLNKLNLEEFCSCMALRCSPLVEPDYYTRGETASFQLVETADSGPDLAKKKLFNAILFDRVQPGHFRRTINGDPKVSSTIPNPGIIEDRRRFRIAFCISGQLRGYEAVWESWRKSKLFKNHDVSVFVHTWKNTGAKLPTNPQAIRVFSGEFLKAYAAELNRSGAAFLQKKYPSLFGLFDKNSLADLEEIKKFYETDFVKLEDDSTESFLAMSNQEKMYHKIWSCWSLVLNSGLEFDAAIRVRPDKLLVSDAGFYWVESINECISKRAVLCDGAMNRLMVPMGVFCGDQFAVGGMREMDIYARTIESLKRPDSLVRAVHGQERVVGHSSLALHLTEGNVRYDGLGNRLKMALEDSIVPTPSEILKAIEADTPEDKREISSLWQAAYHDAQTAGLSRS